MERDYLPPPRPLDTPPLPIFFFNFTDSPFMAISCLEFAVGKYFSLDFN